MTSFLFLRTVEANHKTEFQKLKLDTDFMCYIWLIEESLSFFTRMMNWKGHFLLEYVFIFTIFFWKHAMIPNNLNTNLLFQY